ncbi:MAG: hypothetical protein ACRDU5_03285 [Mycobacterium sp.]
MSDTPEPAPEPSPPTSHAEAKPARDRGQLALAAVAAIAVVALGLSVWALLRPSNAEGDYNDAQRAEAKEKACAAADVVRRGVAINTNLAPPGGPEDVTGTLAVAANARVSLYDGGRYLLDRLDPATPADLADAVRSFGNNLMDIGAAATAGAQNSEPEQGARLRDADAANAKIRELCR